MEVLIRDNERIDDLNIKGLKLIQNPKYFCFGMDSILLAHFVMVKEDETVVDLGTGTGILAILIAANTSAQKLLGIEIQEYMVDMARRSIELNKMEDRVDIVKGDIRFIPEVLSKSSWDIVVTNPPYRQLGGGIINPNNAKAISRHEIKCSLEDVILAAEYLLKHGGRFYMIHRTERLVDVLYTMRKHKIEPKKLLMVHPYKDRRANLFIVEGNKGGSSELRLLKPLYIYNKNNEYTQQVKSIYGRSDNTCE